MSSYEDSEVQEGKGQATSTTPMAAAPVITTGGSSLGRRDVADPRGTREEESGEFDNELKTWMSRLSVEQRVRVMESFAMPATGAVVASEERPTTHGCRRWCDGFILFSPSSYDYTRGSQEGVRLVDSWVGIQSNEGVDALASWSDGLGAAYRRYFRRE